MFAIHVPIAYVCTKVNKGMKNNVKCKENECKGGIFNSVLVFRNTAFYKREYSKYTTFACLIPGPEVIKIMLSSAAAKIYPAHKC